MQDISSYQKIREAAESFYKRIGRIHSPALKNDFVHFASEGFNHLIFKGGRKERSKQEQIIKFKLLPKAKYIIEISTTYQEYDEGIAKARKKRRKKVIFEAAIIRCWGFVAIIQGTRLKVIVRQVGDGQKHFWSVIPAWSTSQYRGIKLVQKSRGNLSED